MPVEINKSDRTQLKAYFVHNAIPTEANFAEFIDATLNQKGDGIAKAVNNPLSIEAGAAAPAGKNVLNLYESFADPQPAWSLTLQTADAKGLGIASGAASRPPRLFIDAATGNVGVGTEKPSDPLDVSGAVRLLSASNPIRFTSQWTGFPDDKTNGAEISNDTAAYKTLMIVGNRSAGSTRRVSVWDRLEVNGSLLVTGAAALSGPLDVSGAVGMLNGSNPIRFTPGWTGFPDNKTNGAEISNDTAAYKTLMIVGNRSAGSTRRVSVWDRLEVNGTLSVTTQESWTDVSFNPSARWSHYENGYARVGYFKDSLGVVHLRGLMLGGFVGIVAFVLPAGYRPTTRKLFACQTNPNTIGRFDVDPAGGGWVMVGNPGWVSVDGLSFATTS